MVRKYLLFGLFTILISAASFAQYKQTGGFARLAGMGANPYVVDPYVMTVNPGWAGHYHNFIFGDLGSSAGAFGPGGFGQFIAANFHVGGGLSLGAMLTRNDFNGVSISTLDPGGVVGLLNSIPGVTNPAVPLDNNLELFGSYKSGNTSVGLGVAYATTTNETTVSGTGTSTGSAMQLGFNAGIVSKLSSSILLDLGASFIMPNAKFEPASGNASEVSQTIIGANARLFWQHSSRLAFVPSVAFITVSGTVDTGTATATNSGDLPSVTVITFGIGSNYQVGDFLFAAGPAFASISATNNLSPEIKTSVFVFPIWNFGVEWDMTDWFVARFGYVAATFSTTVEGPTTETILTSFLPPQRGATVGVGFRLDNFSLDATVNEDVLRQGFNNIGGGGPTFAYLSLSYAMP